MCDFRWGSAKRLGPTCWRRCRRARAAAGDAPRGSGPRWSDNYLRHHPQYTITSKQKERYARYYFEGIRIMNLHDVAYKSDPQKTSHICRRTVSRWSWWALEWKPRRTMHAIIRNMRRPEALQTPNLVTKLGGRWMIFWNRHHLLSEVGLYIL